MILFALMMLNIIQINQRQYPLESYGSGYPAPVEATATVVPAATSTATPVPTNNPAPEPTWPSDVIPTPPACFEFAPCPTPTFDPQRGDEPKQ